MKVDLSQIITSSKLQPQIFKITKSLANDRQGKFLAVVDRNQKIISYIVSPVLFEKLYNQKEAQAKLKEKMIEDYKSTVNDENDLLEYESLVDFQSIEDDMSPEEREYYNNL